MINLGMNEAERLGGGLTEIMPRKPHECTEKPRNNQTLIRATPIKAALVSPQAAACLFSFAESMPGLVALRTVSFIVN
jgi:hypothetical protein